MPAPLYPLGHKLESAPALTAPQTLNLAAQLGIRLVLNDGNLRAIGGHDAITELAPHIRVCKPELVRLLAIEAANAPPPAPQKAPNKAPGHWCDVGQLPSAKAPIDQAPKAARPPLAPDPGHAALLALVMAYCDRTAVSAGERALWAQDAKDTPPELRGDLYQYLRSQLPPTTPQRLAQHGVSFCSRLKGPVPCKHSTSAFALTQTPIFCGIKNEQNTF